MFAKIFAVLPLIVAVAAAPMQAIDKRINHSGQATFFEVGLGACGWTNSNNDMIVALNSDQYEAQNGANCGQWVKITNDKTGNVAYAYVADECPTCDNGSLDMSPTLFSELNNGDMDAGVFPISWNFLKRE